jgi:protein-tyrosine phosphatase
VIDLHAHLLAGIDDGPATIDEAVALAKATVAAGVSEVVATPHVSSAHPNDPESIGRAVDRLRVALADADVPLRVHSGAEIAIDRALAIPPEQLDDLRLGDGPFVMLESPLRPLSADVEPIVRMIQARGHRVLLAHPERSPLFQRDLPQLERLIAAGALTSITSSAFNGHFGRLPQTLSMHLLREGLVHNVVSDMHDTAQRPPGIAVPPAMLGESEERRAERFAWLTAAVPDAIVTGTRIPSGPAPPAHRPSRRTTVLHRLSRLRTG